MERERRTKGTKVIHLHAPVAPEIHAAFKAEALRRGVGIGVLLDGFGRQLLGSHNASALPKRDNGTANCPDANRRG